MNFRNIYQDSMDIICQKEPNTIDDYDEILSIINNEVSFIKDCASQLESLIDKEDQTLGKSKQDSIDSLSKAQKKHEKAFEELQQLEILMNQSAKTIAISDKLRQLEGQKKSWNDGIRYSQNFQRFNE